MNILLIGSGAREHAIARAIKKSKIHTSLFCFGSSSNPGIFALSTGYATGTLTAVNDILAYAQLNRIDWAIIGPEAPLAAGVVDALEDAGIPCVGPRKQLAQLESSKSFTRELMTKYNIPGCPKYTYFSSLEGVATFLSELGDAYVIKADGLMGGKGVKVAGDHLTSRYQAYDWCKELLHDGKTFLIEEKLVGQEFSFISLSDGNNLAHTICIQDHKRAYEGDTGPNTGGMGTYSDANHSLPFLESSNIAAAKHINALTAEALRQEFGMGYRGVLYGGFMATADGVKLIEYNARFGDPEAMNIFALLESDFVEACMATIEGRLTQNHMQFSHKASVCKYAVPNGYPDAPVANQLINVEAVMNPDALYFSAVDQKADGLYETGSRTIAVVGIADTILLAENSAEEEVRRIHGPLFHRADIGTKSLVDKRVQMMQDLRGTASVSQKIRIAVLGSTRGTSLQPVIDAIERGGLHGTIEVVISNNPNAYILQRAAHHSIPSMYIDGAGMTRDEYDQKIITELSNYQIDIILLIGYMRILSPSFVKAYSGKILNVHPSLLPKFAGGMDLNVHKAVIDAGETETGCTIHMVDEGVDTGKIVRQKKCGVSPLDTAESLKAKVQALEGEAFIEVIKYI